MTFTYRELDVVVVGALRAPLREVTGSRGVVRQPRVGDQATIVHVLGSEHCVVECIHSSGLTSWLADFHVDELVPPLERWTFDVCEVSASVYRASGNGPRGMHVESTDTDPDKAIADCRAFALKYPE